MFDPFRRPSFAFSVLVFILGSSLGLYAFRASAIAHGEMAGSGPVGESSADVDSMSVGVDESSGAATLWIPIDLPPGTNGLKPNLALSYSSQSGNGLLGVGWSLGVPKITCSHRFGVPSYAICDRYEFGGEVLVGPDGAGNYHTFDESFSRISKVGVGALETWYVTSTDGTIMTFGEDASSRVQGVGGIAEWHLSTVTDVFGNTVHFAYTMGPAGDEGGLYPSLITYANGTRDVSFYYEPRPDASIGYQGGVRRSQSERLKEVRVEVNGGLHHRLMFSYETSISTTQSRLISVQRFGGDCGVAANPAAGCASLPAAEFKYTDSGEIDAAERWQGQGLPASRSSPWYSPGRLTPDNQATRGPNTQFADVNGDGLGDIIIDGPGRSDASALSLMNPSTFDTGPGGSPRVHLNDGENGWEIPSWDGGSGFPSANPDNESARWTNAIRALRFDIASQRMKQTMSSYTPFVYGDPSPSPSDVSAPLFGTCLDPGDPSPQVQWITDGGSVQFTGQGAWDPPPYFDATSGRVYSGEEEPYPAWPESVAEAAWDETASSEIRPWPHFQFVDLDADGRSDIVMSIHLSGYWISLDSCGSAQIRPFPLSEEDHWVEGATTTVVFMNTGDPDVNLDGVADDGDGWTLDDARNSADGIMADSLPPFGIVAFEAGDLALREIGRQQLPGPYQDKEGGIYWGSGVNHIDSACDDYGLAGLRPIGRFSSMPYDFCVSVFDLTPVFQDFNGDGYPDLMVTKTADPDALFHNHRSQILEANGDPFWAGGSVKWRASTIESVVYLQHPEATGVENDPRWVLAPAYDPPYPHSFVVQISGESPSTQYVVAYAFAAGNSQTYNLDKGVRFADFNRDGLSDMLFSSYGRNVGEFDDLGGVFLNRGAADPSGTRYSAWCSSSTVPNVDTCADEAGRYKSPLPFAYLWPDIDTNQPGYNQEMPRSGPDLPGFELVDLNGDGWTDLLFPDWFGDSGNGASAAYIHQPGQSDSVWLEDPSYRPVEPWSYREPDVEYGSTCCAQYLRAGYGFIDANGDGVVDLVGSEPNHSEKQSWISTPASARSDLLKEYRNGRGLRVELSYASGLEQRDPILEARALNQSIAPMLDALSENEGLAEPLGPDSVFPSVDDQVYWTKGPVLASKKVFRANFVAPTETTYRYAHPRRCHEHKEHLGFRFVEVVGGDGKKTETHYFQKHGRTGKVAERTVFDEFGNPVRYLAEEWELPVPSSVGGGWIAANAGLFDTAYIGRITSRISRNEYGTEVGEDPGFETKTTWTYNDFHGYNFVHGEARDVPGRSMVITTTPYAPDWTNHLMGRVAANWAYANEGSDSRLLSATTFDYVDVNGDDSFNKVGRRVIQVAGRDNPQTPLFMTTHLDYAANGNLIEKRVLDGGTAPGPPRSTYYCYDGDGGCPIGQNSHSLLSGTQDTNGMWTLSEPHDVFAAVARTSSDYLDVPTIRATLDSLGRTTQKWWEYSSNSPDILLSETVFADSPADGVLFEGQHLPYRVSRQFAEAGSTSSVLESIVVEDGAGGALLSIEIMKSVSGGATVIARESFVDVDLRTSTSTDPFPCGSGTGTPGSVISACAAVSTGKTSTTSTLDTLGRPVRVNTPLGIEIMEYTAETLAAGTSGPAVPHDLIFHKNANGALKETVIAAGKPVQIRECNNPRLIPGAVSLANVPCYSPDVTRLTYEPTGELRERTDPTVPAGGGTGVYAFGAEVNQKLRYLYDTAGRIIEIDDPDAGVSVQSYDGFGNLASSVDARGIEILNQYDDLNRLTKIDIAGEVSTEIVYDPDVLNRTRMIDGDLEKMYAYDGLGRIWKETRIVDGMFLMIELERDYLNRPTRIKYPTVIDGVIDAIAYTYDGAFLSEVCDLGNSDLFPDCSATSATPIVSSVSYDSLGRVSAMQLPGGDRNFEYDQNSARRVSDLFTSAVPGGNENISFSYSMPGALSGDPDVPAYDYLGNLLRVDAAIGQESGDPSYSMEYAYDARNRIEQWTYSGETSPLGFSYDPRGNMILHGGETQNYVSSTTAHAIQSRVSDGATYGYTYDASGNIQTRTKLTGGTAHYQFDGRGRLTCIGSSVGGCDTLSTIYNGEGERIKASGSQTYLYAGPDFRLSPNGSGQQEYWIEIHALGQRVAYKHVIGGAVRIVGLFPAWEVPPDWFRALQQILYGLLLALVLGFLVLVATAPFPVRAAVSAGLMIGVALYPVRVWSGGGATNPNVSGTEIYRWVMSDRIGSSQVEIDAGGFKMSHSAYKPFGGIAEESGSGGRSYYAGHDRELNSGLVYMNARWLDPGSGTFMSVDALVPNGLDPQSYNGFTYARNNPVSLIDPTGMDWRVVWTDPETGDVVQKGAWQSGSSSKARAFVKGVSSGAITVASITAGIAGSGGSTVNVAAPAATSPTAAGGDAVAGSQAGHTNQGRNADAWSTTNVPDFPTVTPNSHQKIIDAMGRMDGIISRMRGSMKSGAGPQLSSTGRLPDAKARSMVRALNALANFPISPANGNWLTFQGGMIFIGGAGLLLAGGAIALGVGTAAAGVSAVGLGILGVGDGRAQSPEQKGKDQSTA